MFQPSFQQYFFTVSWEGQGNGHILTLDAFLGLEEEQQVLHYPSHWNKAFTFWLMLCDSFYPHSTQQTFTHPAVACPLCPMIQNDPSRLTLVFTLSSSDRVCLFIHKGNWNHGITPKSVQDRKKQFHLFRSKLPQRLWTVIHKALPPSRMLDCIILCYTEENKRCQWADKDPGF